MSAPRAIEAGRPLRGVVRLPGSKSVTQRYMNLALVAGRAGGGDWALEWPLSSDDTRHFAAGLEVAGFGVEWGGSASAQRLVLSPRSAPGGGGEIHCGHGGTMMRFLVAALATRGGGAWVVDGSARLRERPLGPMLDAMRGLGAEVECLGVEGFPPVRVTGASLEGGRTRLDAGQSSQYLSALLMAGLGARRPVEIEVESLVSAPYVDLTVEAIEAFGGRVERNGSLWRVEPTVLEARSIEVEGDWSAASYWLAGAPLTGGRVEIRGLSRESRQGDRGFLAVTEDLGGRVEWRDDALVVAAGDGLRAVDVDFSSMPDLVPTLAAVAPFSRGITRIHNVAHLRIKESDRLAAMARELDRAGARVDERPDGLVLEGCWADGVPAVPPVTVETYDDHRIAMSLALTGLRRPGISIAAPEVVEKSYPRFWSDLDTLTG